MIDFAADDVARVFATKVLQAKLVPQQESLSMEDAKAISNQVILQLAPTISPNHTSLSLIKLAVWLGVGKDFGLGDDAPSTLTVKVQGSSVNKSANPHRDRELLLSLSHGKSATLSLHIKTLTLPASSQAQDLLDKEVTSLRKELGKASTMVDANDTDDPATRGEASDETWRERYLNLRKEMRAKERDMKRYKRKILEAVMADEDAGRGKR